MGSKASDEQIALVQSVVGEGFSRMDIIRALHMANNDPSAAINIIFDTPHLHLSGDSGGASTKSPDLPAARNRKAASLKEEPMTNSSSCSAGRSAPNNASISPLEVPRAPCHRVTGGFWDDLISLFSAKFSGRGRPVASCSEIVRFSTEEQGEIGRIPNEWARCLSPLVKEKKISIEGFCKSAPDVLGIMDTILLSVSVYINISLFRKSHKTSITTTSSAPDETTIYPLPALFRLLGSVPFIKAELTPDDLYSRKRPMESKVIPGEILSTMPASPRNRTENNQESLSDSDVDNIVGIANGSELEEADPPEKLLCELRPYQRQALHWMLQLEKGRSSADAGKTLHPCWDAYRLSDKRDLVLYLNAFSGDATTEFPSTQQIARGGILADAMGLGKTIMTIALLLAHSDKVQPPVCSSYCHEEDSDADNVDKSSGVSKRLSSMSSFSKLLKNKVRGGNLIVCPMTLLGQWKAEIEAHAQHGSLMLYVHYGPSRMKESNFLAQADVVLTTYGVLASEFSSENAEDNGGLYSVQWFRIILDEAHIIKSSKSQISIATTTLLADKRWCLTGTPIQNNLEDIFSLLRFLRVEPWGNWALWNKLIQKPYEMGDRRGLKMVQAILRPIMLRRTKCSTDRSGRPILVLPPANVGIVYCELTEAEKDFYDALFKRSKVKFDQFVEQGRVLHNYASILSCFYAHANVVIIHSL
ncbi:hypothetical protein HPP92_011264 [Vanilla planifolia]|uniref:Uncharacterized protein n=1 Tax=Vanilla planifolia TaxID=51239 RepID=A0A835R840_VANPL|nr:hypothetical protein HPP92_011264 [Vanilla planifolia]